MREMQHKIRKYTSSYMYTCVNICACVHVCPRDTIKNELFDLHFCTGQLQKSRHPQIYSHKQFRFDSSLFNAGENNFRISSSSSCCIKDVRNITCSRLTPTQQIQNKVLGQKKQSLVTFVKLSCTARFGTICTILKM